MGIYEDFDLCLKMVFFGPWLITSEVVAKARRVGPASESLSFLNVKDVVYSKAMLIKAYERFLSDQRVSVEERQSVRYFLSGARFEQSQALAAADRASEAKAELIQSAREHPSSRGWLRAIPPLLLGHLGYWLVSLGRRKGFYREHADLAANSAAIG